MCSSKLRADWPSEFFDVEERAVADSKDLSLVLHLLPTLLQTISFIFRITYYDHTSVQDWKDDEKHTLFPPDSTWYREKGRHSLANQKHRDSLDKFLICTG